METVKGIRIGSGEPMLVGSGDVVKTTVAELRELVAQSKLVPGRHYRITDYVCSVGVDEEARALNHKFDIIVTADTENILNENAHATYNDSETYFPKEYSGQYYVDGGAYVYAFDGEYVIEGTTYYKWLRYDADSGEYRNEFICTTQRTFSNTVSGTDSEGYEYYLNVYKPDAVVIIDGECSDKSIYKNHFIIYSEYRDDPGSDVLVVGDTRNGDGVNYNKPRTRFESWELKYSIDDGDGVYPKGRILYLKDEFKNEAYYDFKNIQFKRYRIDSVDSSTIEDLKNKYYGIHFELGRVPFTIDTSDYVWCYTFGANVDDSISGASYNNKIGVSCWNIVLGGYCNGVIFHNNCENITLSGESYDLIFHCGCVRIITGFPSNKEIYGDDCSNFVFTGGGYFNVYGIGCSGIVGHMGCYNTYGIHCHDITNGAGCEGNTYGNNCWGITNGDWCRNIVFGNECYKIIHGNHFTNMIYGNVCTQMDYSVNYPGDDVNGDYVRNVFVMSGTYGDINVPVPSEQILGGDITSGTQWIMGGQESNNLRVKNIFAA